MERREIPAPIPPGIIGKDFVRAEIVTSYVEGRGFFGQPTTVRQDSFEMEMDFGEWRQFRNANIKRILPDVEKLGRKVEAFEKNTEGSLKEVLEKSDDWLHSKENLDARINVMMYFDRKAGAGSGKLFGGADDPDVIRFDHYMGDLVLTTLRWHKFAIPEIGKLNRPQLFKVFGYATRLLEINIENVESTVDDGIETPKQKREFELDRQLLYQGLHSLLASEGSTPIPYDMESHKALSSAYQQLIGIVDKKRSETKKLGWFLSKPTRHQLRALSQDIKVYEDRLEILEGMRAFGEQPYKELT